MRWSSVHLDGSPYTMNDSGCAVTCCAMVAAYFGSEKDPGELCAERWEPTEVWILGAHLLGEGAERGWGHH